MIRRPAQQQDANETANSGGPHRAQMTINTMAVTNTEIPRIRPAVRSLMSKGLTEPRTVSKNANVYADAACGNHHARQAMRHEHPNSP
jgi:hypothetical protein